MRLEACNAARSALSERGLTSAAQTKIALFAGAAKNAHVLFLGGTQMLPLEPAVRQLLDRQYFQHCEAALSLAKSVRWEPDPALYLRGAAIALPLWAEAWRALGPWSAPFDARLFYSGIALGHALLAEIRLLPLLPADTNPCVPLVALIHRIEQDDARGLQTYLALLKATCGELPIEERERIIEGQANVARRAFSGFLGWMAEKEGADVDA